MRVLITRPVAQAQGLCEQIIALGAIPECFPTIDIQPTSNREPLNSMINYLQDLSLEQAEKHILIFSSRFAVDYTLPYLNSDTLKKSFTWMAIGPGTARALSAKGISSVLCSSPPFESESLLKLDVLQSLIGKTLVIFRGNGGRSLLPDTLKKRGGRVECVETYQRCLPTLDLAYYKERWRAFPIDVVVTTSLEGLKNLVDLLGPKGCEPFKKIPLVLVGSRMLKLSKTLGFKHPLLSMGADDMAIIRVLSEIL